MHRNFVCQALALALLAWLGNSTAAFGQPDTNAPREKYSTLLKEFAKAQQSYLKRLQGASSAAEQGKVFREENPQPVFAAKFLDLARSHPDDPTAYASLTWIVQNSEFGPAAVKPYAQAIDLLATRYAEHKDSEQLLERMVNSPFASSGKYLEAVFEKHPSRAVRGRAGFHWALYLKNYCDTAYLLSIEPEMAKNAELFVGAEMFKQLKNADSAKLRRQAEDILERVRKTYALVAHKRTNLGRAAEAELFELRNLAVGKIAPEIEGEDVDSKKFKLSDYRGKVVVLVFWGNW